MSHPIVTLVGLSGAGKSTVARLLAERWGWTAVDLDRRVEAHAGMTIPEIFENYGESGFRRLEREALDSALGSDRVVVATGGGAPCQPGAMDAILAAGPAVWLRGQPETLTSRIAAQRDETGERRPLLEGEGGPGRAVARLAALLAAREPVYGRSTLTVDVDHRTAAEVVDVVEAALA